MRAMWSGAIAFGLVNVPVKLYAASASHDLPLHQVHDQDGGRIRYQRRCEVCGEVVPYEHIDRSFEEDGRAVVITDEDLAALPAEAAKEIQVLEFVPSDQIDPLTLGDAYYLEPAGKAAKPYVLLRTTLEQTSRTAVVKYALRQRTRLGVLRVRDDLMVLQSLLWADEVREPDFAGTIEASVTGPEQKMANALVEQLSEDFHPEEYVDDYQVQLRALIEAKLEAGDSTELTVPEAAGPSTSGGEVIDLMAALQASLERKRGGGKPPADRTAAEEHEEQEEQEEDGEATPARKPRTAVKTAAVKTAAKKTTAKRTTAKRTTAGSGAATKSTAKRATAGSSTARKTGAEEEVEATGTTSRGHRGEARGKAG